MAGLHAAVPGLQYAGTKCAKIS